MSNNTEKPKRSNRYEIIHCLTLVVILFCLVHLIISVFTPKISKPHGGSRKPLHTKTGIFTIVRAMDMYEMDTRQYPSEEHGLAVLLKDPGIIGWDGPYMRQKKIPKDGWGRPFRYRLIDKTYVITSAGRDGIMDTDDDISSDRLSGEN